MKITLFKICSCIIADGYQKKFVENCQPNIDKTTPQFILLQIINTIINKNRIVYMDV